MDAPERIALIKRVGVEIVPETDWIGTPGIDRERVELPGTVRSVLLPLSAQNWCDIAMREGSSYVGGCCSAMSCLQDIINNIFRDGGWTKAEALLEIGQLARDHDGFEEFSPLSDDDLIDAINDWEQAQGLGDQLEAWEQLGLIFNALEPLLIPDQLHVPHLPDETQPGPDPVQLLHNTATRLSWHDLFELSEDPARQAQHEAQRMLLRAKLLGPVRDVLAELEAHDEVWTGVAIVAIDENEPLTTVSGLCLYPSITAAETTIAYWQRTQPELVRAVEIVPATVSVAQGLRLRQATEAAS